MVQTPAFVPKKRLIEILPARIKNIFLIFFFDINILWKPSICNNPTYSDQVRLLFELSKIQKDTYAFWLLHSSIPANCRTRSVCRSRVASWSLALDSLSPDIEASHLHFREPSHPNWSRWILWMAELFEGKRENTKLIIRAADEYRIGITELIYSTRTLFALKLHADPTRIRVWSDRDL